MFASAGVEMGASFPRFICAEPAQPPYAPPPKEAKPAASILKKVGQIETPLVVTCATRQFLPSLQQWLTSYSTQTSAVNNLEALVFLGEDVPSDSFEAL
jgi:hypothetical protein